MIYSLSDVHVLWWILILNVATDSDMKSVFVQVAFYALRSVRH